MKYHIVRAMLAVAVLGLAACDNGPGYQPDPNDPPKELPCREGQPCD